MTTLEPDYKLLYEESQKRLAEAEKQTTSLAEQLHLALLEINGLRRKIFGIKSDNRTRIVHENQLAGTPVDIFLGATVENVKSSRK